MKGILTWLLCAVVLSAPSAVAQEDDALPALVQLLGQVDDPQFHLDLLKGMKEGLKGRREVKMPAGWEAVESKLAKSPNAEVRELVQSLSLTFGSSSAMEALRKTLMDRSVAVASRKKALESLLASKDAKLPGLLQPLLGEPALRGAALRGLASYDDPGTPAAILGGYAGFDVAERRDALNTLASRRAYARELLDAVEKKIVPARDLTAGVIRQLRAFKDDFINRKITAVWGVARESAGDKLEQIAKYKALVTAGPPGDPALGRAVFARTCQQCHTLYGVGGKVGPDITGSNRGDLDYILQNAVDPNAVIPNDYRTSNLETSDDRFITGIVTRQDATSVTIVTANDELVIPRKEITYLKQGELSMMPEGLLDSLTDVEVRALVAYLKSPAQVPMLALPENLGGFFNGEDLTGWEGNLELWRVENGEIVGTTTGLKRNEWLGGPLSLGDFRLVLEVKLTPNGGNSGIQFRSERLEDGEVKGYQADVGAGWWGKLYEEHGRALLWKESGETHVKKEDWNTYEIVAVGDRILTAINGHPCVQLTDPQGKRSGIIAFQLHAGGAQEVRYRNFRIELDPKPELKTLQ